MAGEKVKREDSEDLSVVVSCELSDSVIGLVYPVEGV
jgi:hypothetical protein